MKTASCVKGEGVHSSHVLYFATKKIHQKGKKRLHISVLENVGFKSVKRDWDAPTDSDFYCSLSVREEKQKEKNMQSGDKWKKRWPRWNKFNLSILGKVTTDDHENSTKDQFTK